MKNLMTILFVVLSLASYAQKQTKDQLIAFINEKLNEGRNLELRTGETDMQRRVTSVNFSKATDDSVMYEYQMEMKTSKISYHGAKYTFDPSDIALIFLDTKSPNAAGIGHFTVMFKGGKPKGISTFNQEEPEISTSAVLGMYFVQKDDKLFAQLEKAFLQLKKLYK